MGGEAKKNPDEIDGAGIGGEKTKMKLNRGEEVFKSPFRSRYLVFNGREKDQVNEVGGTRGENKPVKENRER